jgi:hypothetical protein
MSESRVDRLLSRNLFWILEDKLAVPAASVVDWAQWFERADRQVAHTTLDTAVVSTVFLGLDQSWSDEAPLIFETVVFGGEHDRTTWRTSTWQEAEETHAHACDLVESGVT